MSKQSQSKPIPGPSTLLNALQHHTPDDDPWKQSVPYTFQTMIERMDADKKEISKREKSMSDKLKTLTKENSDLKQRVSALELGQSSSSSSFNFQAPTPSNPSTNTPWNSSRSRLSIIDPYGTPGVGGGLFGSGSGRKKRLGEGEAADPSRSGSGIGPLSRTLENLRSICGNPFDLPLSSTSHAVAQTPPAPSLKGSTLSVLPIEVLEHILHYLFLEFHNHDRLDALAGLTDPILFPQPWNPISLLRVNRVFRAISFPLFYSQISIDSGRQKSLTLLEMNFIAASSSSSSSSFFPDLELIGEDGDLVSAGLAGRYEKALESMGIKAKRRAEEQAEPVFRPSPRRLVLFVREERASGAARTSSAFYSSLQSLEEHLSDKYAFLRPSDPPRRPLEEIIVSTRSWLLPSLDVTAPILTFIPREVSTPANDWSSSSVFTMAERASKPSAQHSHMRRNSKEKLSTLQIRLPKASAQSSQVHDLEQIKINFHKLTYVRHLRLDFPFALEEAVVQALEAILKSPALLPARHFFDGVRTKISFGVLNEPEAASLRKRVESLGVGEVVEVEVDVIRF